MDVGRSARRASSRVLAVLLTIGWLVGFAAPVGPSRAVAADEFPTVDGLFSGTGAIGADTTMVLRVAGRGGVPPTGVGAVALNVTVTDPTKDSFLTVWPTGGPRPMAATSTMVRGQTTSNTAVVGVGAGGNVSLYNLAGSVDIVVDVLGWFADASVADGFLPVTPARLQDTRPGEPTIDGRAAGAGPLQSGGVTDLVVVGRGGVPPTGVGAVALNVTATRPSAASFLTVWPTGAPRPVAASITMDRGETASTLVIVGVGAGGQVSTFGFAGSVDVIVDVLGWFPVAPGDAAGPGGHGYHPITPARIEDTRPGEPTIDGRSAGAGAQGPDETRDLPVLGRGGVPGSGVSAVVLNVSVTAPTAASFLVAWPAGRPRPLAATLTMAAGETTSNLVVVGVGTGGAVSIYGYAGSVDVVVDVLGWFPGDAGPAVFQELTPARLADTRTPRPTFPLPTYPTGRCDSLAPGLDGLALRGDEHPDDVVRIGTSVLGRPIWAEYYGPPAPTATVLVVGQVHGNECAPSRFVHAIRGMGQRSYGVWLIPTLNPDGYAAFSRANARGRDLNTDGATVTQPETRALMDFTASIRPALTIHVHSPNGTVGGFGSAAYVGGDPAASPAPLAGRVARFVADRSALVIDPELVRTDPSRWFLWQGQRSVASAGESLLLELHAVSDLEVPGATPRPPTQPVAVVDAESRLVISALDSVFG